MDRNLFRNFLKRSKSRRVRSIQEWAEDVVIIPTGPYAGRKFKLSRQPFAQLLYREFSNPHWHEYAITGPTQTGKSFLGFALPVVWTLCEKKEDAIIAGPTMEILADKFKRDIVPIMESSGYGHLIPKKGGGSKGGTPTRIDLTNGSVLKLMSFEGGDKSKASFTCSNIFMTEVDGAKVSTTSDEANPLEQIKGRARATERAERFIMYECTVSHEEGHIWQLTQHKGSAARIVLQCPACSEYVTPERDNLKGWDQAKNEIQAEEMTHWHCPKCDAPWTEQQRKDANATSTIVHRGQEIDKKGKITGPLPETRICGFRWTAVNNQFLPASDIGVDCWNARAAEDDLDAEKKLTQFVFCLPYEPPGLEKLKINREAVERRQHIATRGSVPKNTKWITVGVDVGKRWCHWTAIAWLLPERIGLVCDYGKVSLKIEMDGKKHDADALSFSQVFHHCMDEWKLLLDNGFPDADGELYDYDALWIDARWQGDDRDENVIYDAIKRWADPRILPLMGHDTAGMLRTRYRGRTYRDRTLVRAGQDYNVRFIEEPGIMLKRVHVNADKWKIITQQRFLANEDQPGALKLFGSMNPREHAEYVKHIDSEVRDRHFEPGKGMVEKWEPKNYQNHWLDSTAYACAAGHFVGFRTSPSKKKQQPKRSAVNVISGRGGRSFNVTQR